jgi:hypothetical protein
MFKNKLVKSWTKKKRIYGKKGERKVKKVERKKLFVGVSFLDRFFIFFKASSCRWHYRIHMITHYFWPFEVFFLFPSSNANWLTLECENGIFFHHLARR